MKLLLLSIGVLIIAFLLFAMFFEVYRGIKKDYNDIKRN